MLAVIKARFAAASRRRWLHLKRMGVAAGLALIVGTILLNAAA